MKLSEAIQLGSMLKPQTFGAWGDDDGTCAMGAALDALGQLKKTEGPRETRIKRIWPWLKWAFTRKHCPFCGKWKTFATVCSLIIHLNDEDHVPREQIGKLISEIETRAERQIADLVPSFRDLRLTELESNLGKRKTKNDRTLHTTNGGRELVVQEMQQANHAPDR